MATLTGGGGVGAAVRAIEDGVDETYGDGAELPARARRAAAAAQAQRVPIDGAAQAGGGAAAPAPAASRAAPWLEEGAAREAEAGARLEEIEGRLAGMRSSSEETNE